MLTLYNGYSDGGITVARQIGSLNYLGHLKGFPGGYGFADPIVDILSTSFMLRKGADPREFFGATGLYNQAPDIIETRGSKPRSKAFWPPEDAKKYTTSLGVAYNALSSASNEKPSFENMVIHTSVNGTVIPRAQELYTYDAGNKLSWFGLDLLTPDQHYLNAYTPYYYMSDANLPYSLGSTFSIYDYNTLLSEPLAAVLLKLHKLEERNSPLPYLDFYINPSYPLDTTVGSYNVKLFGTFTSYGGYGVSDVIASDETITYTSYFWSHSLLRAVDVVLTLSLSNVNVASLPPSVHGRALVEVIANFNTTERYYKWVSGATGDLNPRWVRLTPAEGDHTFTSTFQIRPAGRVFAYTQISAGHPEIPELFVENASLSLSGIENNFADNMGLFRPSALLSFSDAISDYRIMTSNYVEVIAEAGELFELAPDLLSLLSAYISIVDGDFGRSAKLIGDFFSGSYLKYKFGWSPNVSNADEITSKLDLVGNALRALQSPATYHGKYWTELPSPLLGYKSLTLLTRSKVRVRGASNDFIIKMLGLDRVGLSPRSSNIWDLVPWSWFIDYFTSLSTRYDVIDSIIIGLMIGVDFCTHSFTIRGPIPDPVLQRNGVQSIDVDPTFTVYIREISRYVPMILDSKIDYAGSKYPPDKGIIASLLWQLFAR